MLYRKASPTPPRLLLRIVAGAGAGAMLGAVACSSSSLSGVTAAPHDGGDTSLDGTDGTDADDTSCHGFCVGVGSVAVPPGEDASDQDVFRPMGSYGQLPDASDAGYVPLGSDAGYVAPDDAAQDLDAAGPCHPVCGLIIRPDQ